MLSNLALRLPSDVAGPDGCCLAGGVTSTDTSALDRTAERFRSALGEGELLEFSVTELDRVGTPVWATWWRGAGKATGGIGYGATPAQARVGGLGELVENAASAHALRDSRPQAGSFREVVRRHGRDAVVDPRLLGLPAGLAFDDDRPLQWLPTRRLRDDAEVWVPAELVGSEPTDLPGDPPPGGWLTTPVTNGLGAGTSREQAVRHGLLEVLQRDGNGLSFRALDAGRVIDLDGVTDPVTTATLERLRAVGIQVVAKLAATDFGLVNVDVVGAAPDDDLLAASGCGEAVHADREEALRKAVLEFASSRARKLLMHGPVDRVLALAPPAYAAVVEAVDPAKDEPRVLAAMVEWLRLPEEQWRPAFERTVLREVERVPFTSLPTAPAHLPLIDVTDRLAAEGLDVLVRDLATVDGGPDGENGSGVAAAKVVVPGLEVETVAYARLGERNLRRLLDAGRDDLVRVGDQPAGWARVHLTEAAQERVGGPAWLDRAALDRVPGLFFPLYREPARHAAPLVLASAD
jgi:ribosomal protein S12 methylthiotransferase accessory factor